MSRHSPPTRPRFLWKVALAAALTLTCGLGTVSADIIDPLHGYAPGASDNGTNTPTNQNPITNFGFTISPGPQTGTLVLDVLVPNNEASPKSFQVTGMFNGNPVSATATLFSKTAWISGQLDSYLGISASPVNPIGAYLPSTQALDPGATGFFVFQVNLGTGTLNDASKPNLDPLLSITEGLPLASYIVGFLNTGDGIVATANSGALFETSAPPAPTPEPTTLALVGIGLAGLAGYGWRRRKEKGVRTLF